MKYLLSCLLLFMAWLNVRAEDRMLLKCSAESGFYLHNRSRTQLQSSLNASLQYRYNQFRNRFLVKSRIVPRHYFTDNVTTVKFSTGVEYRRFFSDNTLDAHIGIKRNDYSGDTFSAFSYNLAQAHLALHVPLHDAVTFVGETSFYHRDFAENRFNTMNGYAVKFASLFDLFDVFRVGTGVYLERFSISATVSDFSYSKNPGYRYGPELTMRLRSYYIASASILFYRQSYDHHFDPESNIRFIFLFGRYISKRTTLFLYINYYQAQRLSDIPVQLSYKPLTDENTYYLKFGYDVKPSAELYLKAGYQSEELFHTRLTFSGAQLLIGLAARF